MNPVALMLPIILPTSADQNPMQMPFDAQSAEEVFAIWKSVFERKRANEEPVMGTAQQMPGLLNASQPVAPATDFSSHAVLQTLAVQSVGKPAAGASADSINVCLQGAAVAIAVRDASLTEEDALHCAFETARTLTGRSAGLQQLTLNGRILYHQASEPTPVASQPSSVLVFAC